jgi:hypothetical protein
MDHIGRLDPSLSAAGGSMITVQPLPRTCLLFLPPADGVVE